MGKEKLGATRQFQRIAALPYNPYFEKEVKQIRQKYAIPTDGKKAREWLSYLEHKLKYSEWGYPLFTPKAKDSFLEGKEARTITEVLESKEARTIYPIEVLVGLEALILLQRFRLPKYVFRNVHQYVLTGYKIMLDPSRLAPKVEFELNVITKGLPEWKVTITGLGPWATKKQWAEIWDSKVKQRVEEARKTCEEVDGIAELGRKRATLEAYSEQMRRWSEWYQLSEIQRLGPKQALDKWLLDEDRADQWNPDEPFALSTVTKAIDEFRDIITPLQT